MEGQFVNLGVITDQGTWLIIGSPASLRNLEDETHGELPRSPGSLGSISWSLARIFVFIAASMVWHGKGSRSGVSAEWVVVVGVLERERGRFGRSPRQAKCYASCCPEHEVIGKISYQQARLLCLYAYPQPPRGPAKRARYHERSVVLNGTFSKVTWVSYPYGIRLPRLDASWGVVLFFS